MNQARKYVMPDWPWQLNAGVSDLHGVGPSEGISSAVALEPESAEMLMQLRRIIATTRRAYGLGLPVMKHQQRRDARRDAAACG